MGSGRPSRRGKDLQVLTNGRRGTTITTQFAQCRNTLVKPLSGSLDTGLRTSSSGITREMTGA